MSHVHNYPSLEYTNIMNYLENRLLKINTYRTIVEERNINISKRVSCKYTWIELVCNLSKTSIGNFVRL